MPASKKSSKPKKTKNTPKHHVPNFLDGAFEFPKLEERVLTFWDEHKIFEKSLQENISKKTGVKGKKFIFYEGPPTANGRPGVHHILSRAFKDVVLRYKTMRGYVVPRKGGWDTHGLPVEIEVEKQLGLRSKKEIEQFGIAAFNEKCKESVWKYKDEWDRMTQRMGFWLDLKDPYITYETEYIETLWWIIAEIAKKKLLYKGHRVVPWCTRCGTALSSHELAQGYKEVEDSSIYVKFKLIAGQKIGNFTTNDKTYILSWTTTPWTLPGNVALAVGEDIEYVMFEDNIELTFRKENPNVKFGSTTKYIATKQFLGKTNPWFAPVNVAAFKTNQLVGLEYEPLFNVKSLRGEKSYKIYPADFVTTTDGTGVVHTAVMYGEDDYVLGKKIGLPEKHTVTEEGKFTNEVVGLEGLYVKAKTTEEKIFEHLKENDNFVGIQKYVHEYPHCWRCSTLILYYARTSWFIGVSGLRKKLVAANETINWVPEHVKEGRFGEWLREAKDWNFSRERYWGTPLPIWECKKCGHTTIVGSMDELSRCSGGSKNNYWTMRHGEAESNVFNIINSKGGKYHLTPRGNKEVVASAKRLKAALAKEGKQIDVVIASDVQRAKETGTIAAEILIGKKPIIDERLEEIHLGPTLDGYRDKKYHEQFPTYQSRFEQTPEGGESLRDVRRRAWEFLEDCEKKYEGKNILLASHEYTIWMLHQTGEGWSEKRTIMEKERCDQEKKDGRFVDFAEVQKLDVKILPRNESGEVDLHRPYSDNVVFPCSECKSSMHRVPEIADVWYDSGAMPLAQIHFPFNGDHINKKEPIDYPADYIVEAVDQTRGWFYTLLAVATLLGREAPYRNVICLGHINDKNGQKMSKSKGNAVDPWLMMEKYGVDAIRWYFFTMNPPGEPKNFNEQDIAKTFRSMHLIIYNSFVFWKTYADHSVKKSAAAKSKNILDQWILARLNETIATSSQKFDRYEIREAALAMESFVDDLSRWYIRRSRRRLQPARRALSGREKAKAEIDYQSASATLGFILLELSKLMAPLTPFFSEMLYSGLHGEKESVHLDEYPNCLDKKQSSADKKLLIQMKLVRDMAALGLAKRAEAGIKVRQPLASFTIRDKKNKLEKEFYAILADEVNVKEIVFNAKINEEAVLDMVITPVLREEGLMREFIRAIQELRQKAELKPKDLIQIAFEASEIIRTAVMKNEAMVKTEVGAKIIRIGKSDKCTAEETIKMEGVETWIGIRRI